MNPYLLLLQHLHALITQHLNGTQGPLPARSFNPRGVPGVGGAQPAQRAPGAPRLLPPGTVPQPAQPGGLASYVGPRGLPLAGPAPAQSFNPTPVSGFSPYPLPGVRA